MRLFIALEISGALKNEILKLQENLKKHKRANYTREENLHITLAFLGETPMEKFADVCAAMNEAAAEIKSFQAKKVGLGSFNLKDNQILYCGIQSDGLNILAQNLRKNLKNRGVNFDGKKFLPHITIARKIDLRGIDFGVFNKETSFLCDKIILFESKRENGKLKYIEKKISRFK